MTTLEPQATYERDAAMSGLAADIDDLTHELRDAVGHLEHVRDTAARWETGVLLPVVSALDQATSELSSALYSVFAAQRAVREARRSGRGGA